MGVSEQRLPRSINTSTNSANLCTLAEHEKEVQIFSRHGPLGIRSLDL